MKKRIFTAIVSMILVLTFCIPVSAAGIKKYYPEGDKKVTNLWNSTFNKPSVKGKKGSTAKSIYSKKVIKPYDANYHFGIHKSYKNSSYSKVVKGKPCSAKELKNYKNKCENTYGDKTWFDSDYNKKMYWFNLEKGKPTIVYTGYSIWDPSAQDFINLYVEGKVVDWSQTYSLKYRLRRKGHPRLLAMTNGNKQTFNGLPSIIAFGIDNVKIKYTFYKATNTNKKPAYWGKGAKFNNLKTNVTYKDIDEKQAISISKSSSGGFTALSSPMPKLKFGASSQDKNFYAISSRANENIVESDKEKAQPYWMSFNINSSTPELIYTSNQKDNKSKPNGAWSFFSTETYDKKITPKLVAPTKRVDDNVPADDVKKDGTHNKLNAQKQAFTYTISQPIKQGLSYDSAVGYELQGLQFRDSIDSCLKVESKKIKIVRESSGQAATNITKYFDNKSSGNLVFFKLKNKKASYEAIYNKGKASTIKMYIPVKVAVTEEVLKNHVGINGKAHFGSLAANVIDLPNDAFVDYKATKWVKNRTNIVQTRVPELPKHDLIIRKNVDGEVSNKIKNTKKFAFTLKINSGSSYNVIINRKNGTTENKKIPLKNGYEFELLDGETLTVKKIPQSMTYRIKEHANDEYKPSYSVSAPGGVLENADSGKQGTKGGVLEASNTTSDANNNNAITYTYTNTRLPSLHDLKVIKEVKNGDVNDQFEYTLALKDLNPNKTYDIETTGTRTDASGNTFTTDSNGNATLKFEIKNNQYFIIKRLPDEMKYKITEKGSEGYKPSYRVTESGKHCASPSGSADESKSLSTPEENVKKTGAENRITYKFTNDKGDSHKLTVQKKYKGYKTNNDDFNFEIEFSNLKKENEIYVVPGATKYIKKNGEETISGSIPSEEIEENHYTVHFALKANEYVVFDAIDPGVKYKVTEKANECVPSFIKETDGETTEEKTGVDNEDLSSAEATFPEKSSKVSYTYLNSEAPVKNELEIEKLATDGSNKKFTFKVNFEKLEHNKNYVVKTPSGNVDFVSDNNGNAEVEFKIANDEKAVIKNLIQGSSYIVTEIANSYKPEYMLFRNDTKVKSSVEGEINTNCSTEKVFFNKQTKTKDTVRFTNYKFDHLLKTRKTVPDDPTNTKEFDFNAVIKGLERDWYMAMSPGDGTFEVTFDENENIKIVAENYNGSLKDIPIKLIRPVDKQERTFYTNENGIIPFNDFGAWLSKGQKGSYEFDMEWNYGLIKGKFSA